MKLLAFLSLCGLVAALLWQHFRYRRTRREIVQDTQPLLYSRSTFHVLTLLRDAPGDDPIEALRKLRAQLEGTGRAKMVYAGRSSSFGIPSSQIGEVAWDAAVLVQYPSRSIYDELAASAHYRGALDRFAAAYSHGLERNAFLNLGIPMLLLALRAYDLVTRRRSRYPFEPALSEHRNERTQMSDERLATLDPLREYSKDAVVIVNLLKGGTAEERAADRGYGFEMARLFAEGGHGPMHMGKAVPVEGDARFDEVILVYYPGIDYLKSMLRSTFFNGIVGGKQLGDTLSVPTVPVLSLL